MEPIAPIPADPLTGTRVGSYVIDRLLGQGGMGSVYVGVQPEIGKRVAVKFLADEFNANVNLVQRFFQEARAVNVIGHENIVDIFDFGKTPDGRNYFVMELLEGSSLEHALVEERAFSVTRVLDVGRQIVRCLVAAHERGIVHRDLKPDNVFLIRRGGRSDFVKVLDFGIAKLTSQGGEPGRTQTGMVLGTPGYMAPEQAGGSTVDHRADIYALGVIIYRALAGHIPFTGQSYAQILRRQLMEDAVPLRRVRADVSEKMDRLVLRMLAREPADRPETMREVEEILDELSRETLATSVIWYTAPVTPEMAASGNLSTIPPLQGADAAGKQRAAPPQSGARSAEASVNAAGPGFEHHSGLSIQDAPARSLGRGGNTGLLIGGALGVIVVGGVLGLTLWKKPPLEPPATIVSAAQTAPTPSGQSSAPATAPVPSAIAPSAAVAPAPVPVEPTVFKLHVETDPVGAAVFDGTKKLGTAPVDIALEKDASLTVHLSGYKDEKIDAHRGHEPVKLTLKKLAHAADPASAPAALPRLPKIDHVDEEPAAPKAKGISIDD